MSRSQPENEVQNNPNQTWLSWDGDKGLGLKKYNKETKTNEIIKLPFKFLVLDRLTTVTGYNEPEKIGYYSNEVRKLTDKLVVRSKNGIEAEGTWEEVKQKLGSKGADYAQSVYIAYYEGKTLTLGNIKMKGAALGTWFTFCKENNVMSIGVTLKESKAAKKGRTEYFEPVFSKLEIKPETDNAAKEIDKVLQEYLTGYLQGNHTTVEQSKTETKAEVTEAKNNAVAEDNEFTKAVKDDKFLSDLHGITDDNEDAPF